MNRQPGFFGAMPQRPQTRATAPMPMVGAPASAARPVPMPQFNAKTLPYKQAGSAAQNFGYTPENINQNLTKLYTDYRQNGVTTGGNKGIWQAMERQNQRLAGNPNAALFSQYMQTGVIPQGLDPQYAIDRLDYGVRDVSRVQQTKKPSLLGQVLKIAAPVALGAIAGPLVGSALGPLSGVAKVASGLKTVKDVSKLR